MKITILTSGLPGDAQPFFPLSVRLRELGYFVKLAAPFRFKSLMEEHEIDSVPPAGIHHCGAGTTAGGYASASQVSWRHLLAAQRF
jgi:hypothetical protein